MIRIGTVYPIIYLMLEQRWLTLDQLCGTLRMSKDQIKWLKRQGLLVTIGDRGNVRYLDPTPEHAEKLRMGAILLGKLVFIPPDLDELALLTLREVAEICGWTVGYARLFMHKHKDVPRVKINSQVTLYSVMAVREILWRRQDRKLSAQRSPFLISELVEFFRSYYAETKEDSPTDAQFLADQKIQRKLELIVRRAERDQVLAKGDLASKVELARKVVQILEFTTPQEQALPSSLPSACDAPTEPHSPRPEDAEHRRS